MWRDTPGELTESTVKCRKNKRRIIKMFVVIISVFGVCWLPYHVYFLYSYHQPTIMTLPYIKHVYLGFYWLAMANCAVNPVIYYWMGNRFRKYFNQLLLCGFLRPKDSLEILPLASLKMDQEASPRSRRTGSYYVRQVSSSSRPDQRTDHSGALKLRMSPNFYLTC